MSKKTPDSELSDEMRPEYDLARLLKGSSRGKYVQQYRKGTNLVLLDPDVAVAFPNDHAVNEALRLAMKLAQLQKSSEYTINEP
jgi:hypothetical protein